MYIIYNLLDLKKNIVTKSNTYLKHKNVQPIYWKYLTEYIGHGIQFKYTRNIKINIF